MLSWSVIIGIIAILLSSTIYLLYSGKISNSNTSQIESSKLSPSSLLEFAYLIGNLKKTERSGWVRKNVNKPESIADHMYRMSILSWIFSDQYNLTSHLSTA